MKQIPLSQGKFALVDDDDYDYLMQWKWCIYKGYAGRAESWHICGRKRKDIYMHRVVNKTPDGLFTDHVNLDRLDNRKENLRNCSTSQNAINTSYKQRGSSKYRGVSWCKKTNKWLSKIKKDQREICFGYFSSEEDAAKAYQDGARKLFGEFVRTGEANIE